jgi:hypothetical protein
LFYSPNSLEKKGNLYFEEKYKCQWRALASCLLSAVLDKSGRSGRSLVFPYGLEDLLFSATPYLSVDGDQARPKSMAPRQQES